MTYHKSNLGSCASSVPSDIDGFVPTAETKCWELNFAHSERTHNDDGTLTEYGIWFEEDRFPEIKAIAIEATAKANASISEAS